MGRRGKRKSRGGGEGPTKSRKRRTPEAAILTRQEECPPASDIDEPQVEDIVKVELEPDVDPGRNDDHQELFDDPCNQDLALNPDIDIGEVEVKVLQYPETEAELTREDDEVRGVDSNMINAVESIGPVIGVLSVYALSKPSDSDGSVRPKLNEIGVTLEDEDVGDDTSATTVGTGVLLENENNETTSNYSEDSMGNPTLNKMAGKSQGNVATDEDVEDDATAIAIGGQHHTEGITVRERAHKMLTRSKSVKKDVSNVIAGANEKGAEDIHNDITKGEVMARKGKKRGEGGGGSPVSKRKPKTVAVATPTRKDDSPPNSEIDEPQLDHIMEVKLEPPSDLVEDNNQPELFDDPINLDLAADPDIDIGNVNLMPISKGELMVEDQDDGGVASSMARDTEMPSIDPDIERNVDGAPSTSKSSEGRAENGTGPTEGEENNEANSNFSSNSDGNALLNKMAEECEASTGMEVEDVDEDTTATTIGSRHLIEGTTAAEEVQEILPQSGGVYGEVLKNLTGVDKEDVQNLSSMQKRDGDIITRLTAELKAATDRNELLQRTVDSEKFRNQELTNQIKLSEVEVQNYTALCEWLKADLEEARGETEIVKLELHSKNADLESQASQNKLLEEEHWKLAEEYAWNANGLQDKLSRKNDLLENAILSNDKKDAVIEEKENELAEFKKIHFRDGQGNSGLHLAVKTRDEQVVMDLIQLGADVNARNNNYETPIILAASAIDRDLAIKIVKYLIEHGADVFARNNEGETFLHKFISTGLPTPSQFHEISAYLVSKNLTGLFNVRDAEQRRTPLMLASWIDWGPNILSLLHVDFTLPDKDGKSVIFYLEKGSNNYKFLVKNIKLHQAIEAEDEELVKLLVRSGADVNEAVTCDMGMETLLHVAASSPNNGFAINIIKFLIDSEANADAIDEYYGDTFLHKLVGKVIQPKQLHDVVEFLISKDLSRLFTTPAKSGVTPFRLAVKYVEIEEATLSLFKHNGIDFNAVNDEGETILYNATEENRSLKMISDLVDHGANPQILSEDNSSVLHCAAFLGRLDLLKFFIDKGLDVDQQDQEGRTPLHFAAEGMPSEFLPDMFDVVELFLENGADEFNALVCVLEVTMTLGITMKKQMPPRLSRLFSSNSDSDSDSSSNSDRLTHH